jgi:hypothetical protein
MPVGWLPAEYALKRACRVVQQRLGQDGTAELPVQMNSTL